MLECNRVNAKLSDSQLNKLKRDVKNKQETTLRLNARMLSANNLPHELLLTTRQTTKLRNAIENKMLTDIKLSKTQISKIIQSGGFLGVCRNPKKKKKLGSGTTILLISNEEMNDIMKIVQALEDSNVLLNESLNN